MSELLLNEKSIISGRIIINKRGAWSASLIVDSNEPVENPVVIDRIVGEETQFLCIGYAVNSAVRSGRLELAIIGGSGKIGNILDAKSYNNVSVRIILSEICQEFDQEVSASISLDILEIQLPFYVRTRSSVSQQLDTLASTLGVEWRVFLDGTLWIGNDAFNTLELDEITYQVLGDSVAKNSMEIATDQLNIDFVPGVTFLDRRISFVEHRLDASSVRTLLMFEPISDAKEDAAKRALTRFIQGVMCFTAYQTIYPGRVVLQHADLTIDVILDDSLMPNLSSVPIIGIYPSSFVKAAEGTRVYIGFIAASPKLPIAMFWEKGTTQPTELHLKANTVIINSGDKNVNRAGDDVNATSLYSAWFDLVATATSTVKPVGALGNTTGGTSQVKVP